MKRYRTSEPVTYGELELLAGITDRAAFWRGKSETAARGELQGRIAHRIAVGDFTPCWPIPTRDSRGTASAR